MFEPASLPLLIGLLWSIRRWVAQTPPMASQVLARGATRR
jgi:hypothetical protein